MDEFAAIARADLTRDQRELLAVMLARLACVDGHVDPFEAAFLKSFLGDLKAVPPVDDRDVTRRGAGCGETLYLVCAMLACVDERVQESERELLARFGRALGLPPARCAELEALARRRALEGAVRAMANLPGFEDEKAGALETLAERLGATRAELEDACATVLG